MRKALFALVMVAAAFVGGAVVNGPGLVWLQTLGRMMARGNGEFVRVINSNNSTPLTPPAVGAGGGTVPPSDQFAQPASPPRQVPAAPLPPLVFDRSKAEGEAKESSKPKELADDTSRSATPAQAAVPGAVAEAETPKPPSPLPLTSIEMPSPMPGPLSEAPPRDAPLGTATASKPSELQPPRPPRPEADRDPAVVLAGGTASIPSPASNASSRTEDPQSQNAKPGDWNDLRRRLREVGVARYEIEADLSGRVRFRCLIPLAGKRAVGQMFEAEGDDEFQAAESAIKRIRLWKISEGASGN